MNRVIIFYPKLFNSYEKFSRKVTNIIKNLDSLEVLYQDDPNEFIKKFLKNDGLNINGKKINNWKEERVTHGIIFDDGEEFYKEFEALKLKLIPVRNIKILITRVINIKKETEYSSLKSTPKYEYIGRKSYWGNPYSMYENGDSREEVIRKYKYDFDYDKFPNKEKSEIYKLAGKRLGCFCKPQACHGDILADFLNSIDDGK